MNVPGRHNGPKVVLPPRVRVVRENRVSRNFIVIVCVLAGLLTAAILTAAVLDSGITSHQGSQDAQISCEYHYSVALGTALLERSKITEQARIKNLSPVAVNDELARHPYPPIPACGG